MKATISFICPFCLGKAAYRDDATIVIHEIPMCKKFFRLPANEYLKQVKIEIQRRTVQNGNS